MTQFEKSFCLLEFDSTKSVITVQWEFRRKFWGYLPTELDQEVVWKISFIHKEKSRLNMSVETTDSVRQAYLWSSSKSTCWAHHKLKIPQPSVWKPLSPTILTANVATQHQTTRWYILYFMCTWWHYCRTWNFLPEPSFSGAATFQIWELWLMLQLLKDKPDTVFQHDQAPQHIHGEMTFLKDSFIRSSQLRGVNFLGCSFSVSDYPTHPTLIFSCGVLWKMRFTFFQCL